MDIEATPSPDLGASLSTALGDDNGSAAGGAGQPRTVNEPESLRDTIAAVVKGEEKPASEPEKPIADDKPSTEDKAAKAGGNKDKDAKADKAADAEKDARPVDEKSDSKHTAEEKTDSSGAQGDGTKPAAANESDNPEKREDGRKIYNAPERFGPDAKELWRNVPHPVRRDIDILERTYRQEVDQYRTSHERYEPIRQYDELARQNGRDLSYSLQQVKRIEDTMQANPIAALEMVLRDAGPRKPDGSALSLYEVAEFIVNQGREQYSHLASQNVPQPPHPAEVQARQAQEEALNLQKRLLEVEVIAPFRAAHPRYDELQGQIAQILKSGMIASNLSHSERLELAYAYAERLNPPLEQAKKSQAPDPAQEIPNRAATDFGGNKSIKPSAGAVSDDEPVDASGKSTRDIIREEMRKRQRA